MDRKKYPNLFRYVNHVDLGPGPRTPLEINWELLPLERAAYELEQLIKQQEKEQEERELTDTASAALQKRISELKQKVSGQPALTDTRADEFILKHLGEQALDAIKKTRQIIENKEKRHIPFKTTCELEGIDDSTFRRYRKQYEDYL